MVSLNSKLDKAPRRAKSRLRIEPFSSEKLKELRAEKRLSQTELAEATGIPLGTIKHWEQGIKKPGLDSLAKLGKFFGVKFYADWDNNPTP